MSAVSVQPTHNLPTQETLDKLLEKIVAIFEVESVLKGKSLPSQPLQREYKDSGTSRTANAIRRISGNDFHINTSYSLAPSWEAVLQFDRDSGNVALPLSNVDQHPEPGDQATVERAVELLRASWPDATVGALLRGQLGPSIYHPESLGSRIFEWVASKELNPILEGVFVNDLWFSEGRFQQLLREMPRGLTVRSVPESERQSLKVSTPPADHEKALERPADAQIWTFVGPDSWVISLPILIVIILLMTNPTKNTEELDFPDRELSWCLDSMHGFCRKKGPEEGDRHLSWSFGTFPDHWMYFHFVFHYLYPSGEPESIDESEEKEGTGIRCDRRKIVLPIGWNGKAESFKEERVWFGMRAATPYESKEVDISPSTVGFVMSQPTHFKIKATKNEWLKSGLESPKGASGVALFHLLLWQGMDEWNNSWGTCINYIEKLHDVEMQVLEDKDPEKLTAFTFDPSGQLAMAYFKTAYFLKELRGHIDVLPQSLFDMKKRWERIYPGYNSDRLGRFDEATQLALLKNWSILTSRAEELHVKLISRIDKKAEELLRRRDSLFITKGFSNR